MSNEILFRILTPILTGLPCTPRTRKFVSKVYLWLCKKEIREMLMIYYTYQTEVNVNDVSKILKSDGWSVKKIELIHTLCLMNGLIELGD